MASTNRIERLFEAQAETARTINRLMLTSTVLGLVGFLVLGFPDVYMLSTKTTVSVPFGGAASFKTMLLALPVIVIAVRVYLQIYVHHWRRLDRITKRFSTRRVPVLSPLRQPLLRLFTGFILYALVPLVLSVLAYKAMVIPSWGVALLGVTVVVGYVQVCPKRWLWPAKIVPPIIVVAAVTFIIYEGKLSVFRRSFQLELADLERAILTGQDMKRANLVNTNLRQAKLFRADLGDAKLYGAELQKANLHGANLQKASLWAANLQGASLFRANLQEASLNDTNLQFADLREANLRKTTLYRANLSGANLQDTNVTQKQLAEACGNKNTSLPASLTVKTCR